MINCGATCFVPQLLEEDGVRRHGTAARAHGRAMRGTSSCARTGAARHAHGAVTHPCPLTLGCAHVIWSQIQAANVRFVIIDSHRPVDIRYKNDNDA